MDDSVGRAAIGNNSIYAKGRVVCQVHEQSDMHLLRERQGDHVLLQGTSSRGIKVMFTPNDKDLGHVIMVLGTIKRGQGMIGSDEDKLVERMDAHIKLVKDCITNMQRITNDETKLLVDRDVAAAMLKKFTYELEKLQIMRELAQRAL